MRKQYFLFILLFPIILISCQPKSSFGKNTLDEILEPEMKVPSVTPTSISQEPSSTPTANLLIDPEFWPYQRYNQNTTAAYSQGTWQLLEDPAILWDIEDSELAFMGPLSVAGDLDGDGRAEYVVARRDPNATNSRLSVFNIEDGRILWEKSLDWYYDHCAPIIADLDGDSKLDIVYAEAHLNNPSPKLVALLGSDGSVLWERNLEGGCQSMAIADFDNDGMQEIVLHLESSPRMLKLLDGSDGSQIWSQNTIGSGRGIITPADIDQDGFLEILTHHHNRIPNEKFNDILVAWESNGEKIWAFEASPTADQAAQASPELGYASCENDGGSAVSVADFNADGKLEIGFGERCQYHLLDTQGEVLWSTPSNFEGWGYLILKNDDGTPYGNQSIHSTGGMSGYKAIGNMDDDPALEIVFSVLPEYRAIQYLPSGKLVYEKLNRSNMIWALDGASGQVEWTFEGDYIDNYDPEKMFDPILVDLTGDGKLDVLVISLDRHLYAIHGETGKEVWSYGYYPPPLYLSNFLTFVPDNDQGILMFVAHRRGQFYTLTAMHLADLVNN